MESKRKCVGCLKLLNREGLIKLTCRNTDEKLIINPDLKTFGRSAYLCYNKTCIENAFKKNKLKRMLKTSVPEDLKGQLIELTKHEG